ncbi:MULTISPECIES: ABC transporter permease [unclassified Oceanispirochaeta]|uniref:ABC transporter permease n=1 Tax=unclassified Oceanispirochaeta TaxID=2635722 RepID=UPI000E098A56|nr:MULTISPECIES: ABC transporter permease [unclassified Oceanispirochaeta]MBF9017961.1 ABC transporter permease [Oceanispirochaeta sp. M2]NPD74472.1 ABC transporter permease [Oceanispirochaeta sp. M1]RDG29680.1 ABC transporter permease [Oceanispirochaeta sp. M1]
MNKLINGSVLLGGNKKFDVFGFLYRYGTIIVTILAIVYFSVSIEHWFTFGNVTNIFRSVSIVCLIALAMTMSLTVDGFDLSTAATASFAAVIAAKIMIIWQLHPMLAVLLPIAVGCMIGLVNSFLIIKLGISDMLATLSMMFVITGVSITFQQGSAIYNYMPMLEGGVAPGLMSEGFKAIGQKELFEIPIPVFIMLAIAILVHVFLNWTKYGRFLYMTGGNVEAARLSGIPTSKYRTLAYVLSGAIAALAGVVLCARLGSGEVDSAGPYLMDAVAAAYIGFSVLGAGKPNAFGTLLGALLVGILMNGLVMMSFPYYSQNIVKGVVLILGLGLTYYKKKG